MLLIYFVFFVVGHAANNAKRPKMLCDTGKMVSIIATRNKTEGNEGSDEDE